MILEVAFSTFFVCFFFNRNATFSFCDGTSRFIRNITTLCALYIIVQSEIESESAALTGGVGHNWGQWVFLPELFVVNKEFLYVPSSVQVDGFCAHFLSH